MSQSSGPHIPHHKKMTFVEHVFLSNSLSFISLSNAEAFDATVNVAVVTDMRTPYRSKLNDALMWEFPPKSFMIFFLRIFNRTVVSSHTFPIIFDAAAVSCAFFFSSSSFFFYVHDNSDPLRRRTNK